MFAFGDLYIDGGELPVIIVFGENNILKHMDRSRWPCPLAEIFPLELK